MGLPWREIEALTLRITKKLGLVMETEDGQTKFYKMSEEN
jgi:hypothetical protein